MARLWINTGHSMSLEANETLNMIIAGEVMNSPQFAEMEKILVSLVVPVIAEAAFNGYDRRDAEALFNKRIENRELEDHDLFYTFGVSLVKLWAALEWSGFVTKLKAGQDSNLELILELKIALYKYEMRSKISKELQNFLVDIVSKTTIRIATGEVMACLESNAN